MRSRSFNVDWHFLISHPAHFVAFTFGVGLIPIAPGTFGTLAAIPLYAAMQNVFVRETLVFAWFVLLLIGVWACEKVQRRMRVIDYGGVCWDETVAFLAVLYFTPAHWAWWAVAFVLFRLFDIWKPYPIAWFEQRIKSGFGVMLDDLLAAAYTIAIVQTLRHVPGVVG